MKYLRTSFFTFIELLVVIFILSITTLVFGVKIKKAHEEQGFLAEVDQIINHLQLAQELMLMLDVDVHFYLVKETNGSMIYYLDVAKPLVVKPKPTKQQQESRKQQQEEDLTSTIDLKSSRKWSELVERRTPLKAIRSFVFEDQETKEWVPQTGEQDLSPFLQKAMIRFSLGKMSQGELQLSTAKEIQNRSEDDRSYSIKLKGYPCAIRHQEADVEEAHQTMEESKRLYPIWNS